MEKENKKGKSICKEENKGLPRKKRLLISSMKDYSKHNYKK